MTRTDHMIQFGIYFAASVFCLFLTLRDNEAGGAAIFGIYTGVALMGWLWAWCTPKEKPRQPPPT